MVEDFKELRVYQRALAASMQIFEMSSSWPKEETYSLIDQIRRSSRSVCSNIGEAWFKRLYKKHFVSKLSDATSEAAETIVWLDVARECGYMDAETADQFERGYRQIIAGLITMMEQSDRWCGPSNQVREQLGSYESLDSPNTAN
jgi:four helix bundle protein